MPEPGQPKSVEIFARSTEALTVTAEICMGKDSRLLQNRSVVSLEDAVVVCSGNPFRVRASQWTLACKALREAGATETSGRDNAWARLVRARARGQDSVGAEALLLAAGHVTVTNLHEAESERSMKRAFQAFDRLKPRTQKSRIEHRRIVAAAGRCYRALMRMRGRSQVVREVRSKTWSACFGESLLHGLRRERVVRDHDVLITGETGTGKELVAHAVQQGTLGGPDGGAAPSSALNAAAIPDALVESELFGHVKGAFTGAARPRIGRLRAATRGCLFLDEVGDLPQTVQVKLLRVMETDRVYPVGSDQAFEVDVRYVAATHQDLPQMIDKGAFRRDLHERLAGVVINMPPLRERPSDIVDIGLEFVRKYLGDAKPVLEQAEAWLSSPRAQSYTWPGNVRELQNALRTLILGLEPQLGATATTASSIATTLSDTALPPRIQDGCASWAEVQKWYIHRVLERTGGNYAKAARILALDRATVRRHAARE